MPRPENEKTIEPVRLNKYLAQAGVCSRRAADERIIAGRVSVNGRIVDTPGVKVEPDRDEVRVDGKRIKARAVDESAEYILLHKPVRVVTTAKDPQGRQTVLDLLPKDITAKRVYPVGRLDFFSEGLLLLTTDGDLAHRLTHPRYHLPKEYRIVLREKPDNAMLERMRQGMVLEEGEKLAPVEVKVTRSDKQRTELALTLIQGVNRQIRRMCRDLGLTILKLVRVRQGPVHLGDLAPGKWRRLTPAEVEALKKAVGLKK